MKTEKQMTDAIMRRVYAVYFFRKLAHPAVRISALFGLAVALREMVWVTRIFENISHKTDVFEFFQYGFSAFTGTEFVVQMILIAGAGIVIMSARDLFGYKQAQLA